MVARLTELQQIDEAVDRTTAFTQEVTGKNLLGGGAVVDGNCQALA